MGVTRHWVLWCGGIVVVASGGESAAMCDGGTCASRRKCVAWRQTAGCAPGGRRESRYDIECDAVVGDGRSGYCECADGSRARASSCSHEPFTCRRACESFDRETCSGGWRASATCEADGPRDPARDQTCRETVTLGVAGYCECGLGRRVFRSGCDAQVHVREPLVCDEACALPESLYEVMDLPETASEQEIKKSFRELSRLLHPDKIAQRFGGGDEDAADEANERFKEVRYAYDVLSQPSRRAAYDAGGHSLLAKYDKNPRSVARSPDVNAETRVTLETLYHGANLTVAIDKRVHCKGCSGSSSRRCSICTTRCPSEVVIVKARMGPFMVDQQQRQPSKEKCRTDRVTLPFTVRPGSLDGEVINFAGEAPQDPNALNGDVHLKLLQQRHARFDRNGDDLRTTVTITLRDALIGFRTQIVHLGGHLVDLVVEPGDVVAPGTIVRIAGEGMPRTRNSMLKGDLFVEYNVQFPESLDAATRAMVDERFPDQL